MKNLKLDLQKLSQEAIDRIIEAVRNETAGNIIFEIEQAEPVAWRDPKTGSLCTPRNKEYGLKSNYASDYAQYSEPLYIAGCAENRP